MSTPNVSNANIPDVKGTVRPDTDANQASSTEHAWLNEVAFNADGLLPAIAQDKDTGDILMMAWMNADALKQTALTQTAIYFSRSRGKLWRKGETSGHTQQVHAIYLDCDADALILSVTQAGGIACHTGRRSCFYRRLALTGTQLNWQTVAPVLKSPDAIYAASATKNGLSTCSHALPVNAAMSQSATDISSKSDSKNDSDSHATHYATEVIPNAAMPTTAILSQLDAILQQRKQADADDSYVASLYAKGINKILEKVGEEAIETVLAAKDLAASRAIQPATGASAAIDSAATALVDDLVYEIADMWFHTLVTLAWFNIQSDQVLLELARRFGLSGIEEKNSRNK